MKKRPSKNVLSRRDFVVSSAGAALALPLVLQGCAQGPAALDPSDPQFWDKGTPIAWDPEAIPLDETLFPCGTHAGAMHSTSAIFWCYATEESPKRLKVWREGGTEGQVVLVNEGDVETDQGYIKVEVTGLAPGTWYRFTFLAADESARSAIANVRTALGEESMEPLTIAATTCTHYNHRPYKALEVAAKHDYDVFCQLGDMTYNDGALTREEFRVRWRETLADPGYRAIMEKAGLYATMDDHEIADDSDRYGLPEEVYESGKQAFLEALAIPEAEGGRFWESFRWGKTAEFFVLDCRTERDPMSTFSENQVYISQKQMDWLKDGLKASPCVFKIILNSVPILGFTDLWPEVMDRWQAFPDQRDELLDFILGEEISSVFFLTGDYHLGYAARLEPSGPRSAIWEIMVGPGCPRIPNPLVNLFAFDPEAKPEMCPEGQFDYIGNRYAATLMTFDPKSKKVHVRYLDYETEEVLYEGELTMGLAES